MIFIAVLCQKGQEDLTMHGNVIGRDTMMQCNQTAFSAARQKLVCLTSYTGRQVINSGLIRVPQKVILKVCGPHYYTFVMTSFPTQHALTIMEERPMRRLDCNLHTNYIQHKMSYRVPSSAKCALNNLSVCNHLILPCLGVAHIIPLGENDFVSNPCVLCVSARPSANDVF